MRSSVSVCEYDMRRKLSSAETVQSDSQDEHPFFTHHLHEVEGSVHNLGGPFHSSFLIYLHTCTVPTAHCKGPQTPWQVKWTLVFVVEGKSQSSTSLSYHTNMSTVNDYLIVFLLITL